MDEKTNKTHDNAGSIFGANLRKIRKSKGWTPEKLFQESGVSVSAIRKYERGERFPERPYVEALASALNCRFLDLYGEQTDQSGTSFVPPAIANAISAAMKNETEPLREALAEISRQKDIQISALENEIRELKQDLRNKNALISENRKALAYSNKIPGDILSMLSKQGDKYFSSLRRVLNGIEEKRSKSKISS